VQEVKIVVSYLLFVLFLGCSGNLVIEQDRVLDEKSVITQNMRSDALVVGVGEYKNNIRPLDGVKKDLLNIKRLFHYLNINNITTLKNEKATLQDVRKAFNSYINSNNNRKGNIFVFYYSGHGIQVIDKNDDEKDKKDEATALYDLVLDKNDFIKGGVLLDDELAYILSNIKSKKILIFDKCHSGSSHRGDKPYIKSIGGEYQLSTEFLNEIGKNIKHKKSLKNFVIFSATKDDEDAEDSPLGGLFTNSFIDGILHKKGDINKDGKITVSELESFCTTNISHLAITILNRYKETNLKGNFNPCFSPVEIREETLSNIFNFNFKLN